MIISKLDPAQAVSFWDTFSPGVEEIHLLSRGEFGWQPADVLRAFKDREAAGCFVYDNEERVGWFIYRYMVEAASRRPFCHIWLAWAEPKWRGKLKEIQAFCTEWLAKEARKYHCKYLEMDSNRAGWMRDGPRLGFKPHRIVFRKEI